MKLRTTLALAATAALSAATGATAATVINGNFEDNAAAYTVWPGYNGQEGVNPGAPTGWVFDGGGGVNPVQGNPPNGPLPFNDGSNTGAFAFLQNTGRMDQTISDFVVGQSYLISFTINARNCCDDFPIASVFMDDNLLRTSTQDFPAPGSIIPASLGNGGNWWGADLPFTATGTSHTLSFRTTPGSGNPAGDSTLLVDNVSITLVPEPGAAALATLALGACALRRRRA